MKRAPEIGAALACALVLALAAGGAVAAGAPDEKEPAPLRVLFVGNSLTYTNDLPEIFAALARASGRPRPVVRAVAAPGFSLEDHWSRGDAKRAIAAGPWEFVVLQQGPSASREGRSMLRAYTGWFAGEIRSAGARPALYMVWPSASRPQDAEAVARSYAGAAKDIGGVLCPAGEAWRIATKRDRHLELYSADGLHPTPAGSYLAALVIFGALYQASPVGLPSELALSDGERIVVPPAQARVLQEAAAEALAKGRLP